MFESKCANPDCHCKCGNKVYAYAVNKLGTLEKKFCCKVCEGDYKDKRRFIDAGKKFE